MRVTVVSAHYPPNFVSGGTLQPQRLAHGLRSRGHDIQVFAGWLGARKPLDTWTEVDDTGMPVQWISSGEWIGWEIERNWYNIPVARVFREHLEEFRPDVVHLHSLQSLGGALVPVAKEFGARVVVTMHDFWWLCTRQFLVDPEYNPCCLVQTAGICPCQNGPERRDERTATLATLLASADLVLAPSSKAADVLIANGIAPGRVEVDENGLPASVAERLGQQRPSRPPHELDTAIRFLYAGGPDPMKGIRTLLDAADSLGNLEGWQVTAVGAAEYLEKTSTQIDPGRVKVRPPYLPDELDKVLDEHDVLVLPSLARETHSLLTREALAAGIPVICSDTPGPTEVIFNEVNGLVVPAGDVEALASAMRSVVDDPELLTRISAGAREPIIAPSIEDQVIGLEDRFTKLLAIAPNSRLRTNLSPRVRSVLFVCGINGAPLRYRAQLPAESLALLGVRSEVRHYRDPELLALGRSSDVVVFYRVPATIQILELISALRGAGVSVIFDVDDLIFDPEIRDEVPALQRLPKDQAALWLEGVKRYRTTLEACDAYIGSTNFLVEHVQTLTGIPSFRYANGVGSLIARYSDAELRRPRKPGPVRIGYLSGTTTHDDDWFFIEPAVVKVLDHVPDVEVWLGGHLPDSPALASYGHRVRRLPFVDWRALPATLRDLDVNLAPLSPGSRFNEAKSAIKWLEAALCATPTVASPTEPFIEAIQDGSTGRIAESVDDWYDAIAALVSDAGSRARIGGLARDSALLRWSPALQARRYADILSEVIELCSTRSPGHRRSSTWVPVALDEPSIPGVTLESYDDDGRVPGSQLPKPISGPVPESVEMRVSPREEKMILTKRAAVERTKETLVKIRRAVRSR